MGIYITGGTSDPTRPGTAVRTSVPLSTTSVTLVAANADRRFVTIFNTSNRSLFLAFGPTASLTDFTAEIPKSAYFEGQEDGYTGEIAGIWASAGSGAAKVTEIS